MPDAGTPLNQTDRMTQHLLGLPDADIHWYRQFLAGSDSKVLFQHLRQLDWQQPAIKIFGRAVAIPRRQIWMGDAHCSYRYSGVTFAPEPWTEPLQQLRQHLQQVTGFAVNAALLNWYQHGEHHMGWHSDDEPELGVNPVVLSVSLGQSRKFDLKHKTLPLQCSVELADGDLLVMAGACQHYWQHRVPKQLKADGERINLTFRYLPENS